MKKSILVLLILVVAGAFLFYALSSNIPKYPLGANFSMQIGDRVQVGDTELTFEKITEDSRCPTDVICVWQGSLEAKLTFKTNEISEEILIDWTAGGFVIDKYKIQILDVQPETISTKIISDRDYNLTFVINIENSQAFADSISQSAVNYFTDALRRLVITKHGWPFYGFTPDLFLDVLPGLKIEDFNGIQGEQGIYEINEEGTLIFNVSENIPAHASAEAISNNGMKQLLENISLKRNITITDTQSVIDLLKSLKIRNG